LGRASQETEVSGKSIVVPVQKLAGSSPKKSLCFSLNWKARTILSSSGEDKASGVLPDCISLFGDQDTSQLKGEEKIPGR
jgi:hypothetical protein